MLALEAAYLEEGAHVSSCCSPWYAGGLGKSIPYPPTPQSVLPHPVGGGQRPVAACFLGRREHEWSLERTLLM